MGVIQKFQKEFPGLVLSLSVLCLSAGCTLAFFFFSFFKSECGFGMCEWVGWWARVCGLWVREKSHWKEIKHGGWLC